MNFFWLFVLINSYAQVRGQEIIRGPYGTDYILIEELNFAQAVEKCASLNATLPTPKTEVEVAFVSRHTRTYFYLGAKVKKVSGECVANWLTDGTEVTNAKWYSSHSTCGGDVTCVELSVQKNWFMVTCSTAYSLTICQKKRKELQEQVYELILQQKRMTLAKEKMEKRLQVSDDKKTNEFFRQIQKDNLQTQEMLGKNGKENQALSVNINLLIGLVKNMSTEFNYYKKKVDYLYG